MDLPAAAGGALGQPTRAKLFAELEAIKRAATTEELAARLGLHVNGVRRHLGQLAEARLVERRRVRHGRGRPRDEWAISNSARPAGERPRAYADLSRWLARVIPETTGRLREVEHAGREIGRGLAPAGESAASTFADTVAALGFQPEVVVGADGSVRCTLCNCPYRDSARESADVICTLHRGITAGLIERLAPAATLTRFEPRDPDRAGCVLEIVGTGWSSLVEARESD